MTKHDQYHLLDQDIKDVSDWSKDKLQNSDEKEVISYEEETI